MSIRELADYSPVVAQRKSIHRRISGSMKPLCAQVPHRSSIVTDRSVENVRERDETRLLKSLA
jgi:hypothetical protein